ncbi:MAG: hypothetical protein LBT86_01300 [Deltaproteobacteria bacterium]|jgi:hypothetical protein|nr:hypothetical protein [Deltaproteobacteria bacterium]
MSLLRLALIAEAKRELTLSADETPIGGSAGAALEVVKEKFDTLEGPAFRKVGVATVSQVFLTGFEVVDLNAPADSLKLSWYLPDEEEPNKARAVDMNLVGLIPQDLKRDPPALGQEWWRKLEARGPVSETLFFETGFQPPFRASDVVLYLTDLKNFGFDTFILSQVAYGRRVPAYTEAEWGFTQIVSEGRLAE